MGDGEALTVAELRRIVRGVDPSAFVVPGRVVRRAIKHDRGLPNLRFRVPHHFVFALDGPSALRVVDRDELGLGPGEEAPGVVILLAEPEADGLAERPRAEVLLTYWRRLHHARVHVALERRFAEGAVGPVGLRERIRRLDPSAFEEARTVLRLDDMLLPPRSDSDAYVEFAASYLGLRAFAGHLLPRFFPAIRDPGAVDRLLAEDVDADALLASTRLPGSARISRSSFEGEDEDEPAPEPEPGPEPPSKPRYRRLLARADLAERRGNLVRGAMLRTRAARLAGPSAAGQARSAARDSMHRLAERLEKALGFDSATLREWRKALVAPLGRSSRGFWTPEARMLYDLQKVCVDHERPSYSVNLIDWAFSLGRKPLKRLLPYHQEVLIMQHLRGAAKHLASARLPDVDRSRLSGLLDSAVHRAEGRLRDRFRPEIARTLERTGFEARNLPERVSLQKLNEELLDQVVRRGFLAMGDLRDALSRNNRKLPDLAGPIELIRGDRLLRADRGLAASMDGVYRGGEAYLRLLQRMSSVAFGTRAGRFLTRYLAIPYGGAALILSALEHVVDPLLHLTLGLEVEFLTRGSLAGVGTLILLLIASRDFRTAFGRGLRGGYELARGVVVDAPTWVLRRPWVRRVLASRTFRLVWRAIGLPMIVAALAMALHPSNVATAQALTVSAMIFLTTSLVLTTRAGRDLEEMAFDSLVRAWSWLAYSLLPGLFRLVVETFARVIEAVERVLYTVDEWLRFRDGQGSSSLAAKAVLGTAWFVVAYVVRFAVTLLLEPQVNPIKHFPVVTVSHKLMLTQLYWVTPLMSGLFGKELGPPVAVTFLGMIPGIFGFLVWELKENWRLYEANRPSTLRPVMIGHHGETMARLLKPGFHSGTLPKLFARLRRAERDALRTGHGQRARKQVANLHGVEEEVRHFVDREFLALLLQSRSMGSTPLAIGGVIPGAKRFLIELVRPGREGPALWLSFEEHSGWLVAGIDSPGWLVDLSPPARDAFALALAGLYKMAGVQVAREPIVEALGPEGPPYNFREEGIVVWPDESSPAEALYLLRPAPVATPLVTIDRLGRPSISPPRLDTARLLFSGVAVTWQDWVDAWERDRAGEDLSGGLADRLGLLPPVPEGSGLTAPDPA